ncbi:arylsulfatase [Aporhodopirellula aestuarii]|uniref:Arylsulfatase n=1 Tax=Aporhodopirellula aestuarii TaxID=2950107 RepID=A0ABT0TY03_9BACT|nr:arylsulfatase [Aporhodopirellula aestuarii]MCM2369465.1 arylsulfatase [Aporhodopirellula aestuarii]
MKQFFASNILLGKTHNMMMKSSLCLLALQLLVTSTAFADRPNVIVIMTDDQGYGEFSCHGNPITQTPNIDKIARDGIRLTDFHVAPMCTPTRGQLMTGLDAFRNGASNVSSGRTLLKTDVKTIANVFQDAGYRTGIFGKWHLGDNYPFRPEDRGFDEALWFPSSHINSVPDYWDNDYFDDTYIRNGQRRKYHGYCTDVFFDEAASWIAKEDERPFFAYIALNAAHWPWFVPDKFREPIRQAIRKNPEVVEKLNSSKREDLVSFLAMGANIDENVGKLDERLTQSDVFDNTIVIFLTDNGSTMGQDYFNAGMRGKKTQLWEGGHRVPCFIRWPAGSLGDPRDVSELSHVQDIMPTLADLAGVADLPGELDGQSLAPILRGEKDSLGDRMLVINYSRMPGARVNYTRESPAIPRRNGAAVLWKRWRLLENRMLFDLESDPHQDHNVAADHPGVVAKMRAHLDHWWDGVKDDVRKPQRVIIGSDAENPMLLSACEWLDVFVDQQRQVRDGVLKNGTWHLHVARAGTYRLELRRWPRESGLQLTDSLPETRVTDGEFVPGKSLPITSATLQAGDQKLKLSPQPDKESFVTEVELDEGNMQLRTSFFDPDGNEICGAYYVYVNRQQ